MDCKNCSTTISSSAKFCKECGQSVVNYNKPIRPVLTDMLHESLDIDGRLFATLNALIFKPGQLSVAYREGQRARYTPPLRLYLVISIGFFLLLPMLDPGSQVMEGSSPLRTDIYPKIIFVLLPLFTLLLHLLFRGTFFLSNLVFSIHIHCITYLVIALILPMEANEKTYSILLFLQIPFFIYLFAYALIALKRYFFESWSKTVAKFIVLFLVYSSVLGLVFDYLMQHLVS